jgi:hypothetical protein
MRARFGFVLVPLLASLTGCSLGQGEGEVTSKRLYATDCWDQQFDLGPDFFAAVPYRNTMLIRVQRSTDLQEVSDGLDVLIDDVGGIRDSIKKAAAAGANAKSFGVSLPAGVHPPGTPVLPPKEGAEAPVVHMALYLQRSCHNQNTILYSISGTAQFNALFSGDPNEKDAAEKYTDAFFDVQVGDIRDAPVGAQVDEIPLDKQSHLSGYFRFYFERGQPGQPFP